MVQRRVLSKIKAKEHKLIFIDACQSIQTVRQDKMDVVDLVPPKQLSEAWNNLITTKPDYRTLLSCSKGEASFELAQFQHGAFTQALLEAFANAQVVCRSDFNKNCRANLPELGGNPDHILTFQELSDFVKKRVPYLVKQYYNGPNKTPQNPTVRDNNPNEDIPVFWFDK